MSKKHERNVGQIIAVAGAVFTGGVAIAQSLPTFGLSVFGVARFGGANVQVAIPATPIWALLGASALLCLGAYKLTQKKNNN